MGVNKRGGKSSWVKGREVTDGGLSNKSYTPEITK